QGIENKMRVDMSLDRFQLQLFYQRFQLKRIQLLFSALGNVVVNEIKQVPDKEIDEKVKSSIDDQEELVSFKFLLAAVHEVELRKKRQVYIRSHEAEKQ